MFPVQLTSNRNGRPHPVDAQFSEHFYHGSRSAILHRGSGLPSCRLVLSRKHRIPSSVSHYPALFPFWLYYIRPGRAMYQKRVYRNIGTSSSVLRTNSDIVYFIYAQSGRRLVIENTETALNEKVNENCSNFTLGAENAPQL